MNIKMNDFVGNILQSQFYACCYILLSGTRPKCRYTHLFTALLWYFRGATGAEISLLLTSWNSLHPIHAADGHYTRTVA